MGMAKHQKTLLEIIPLHGVHKTTATITGVAEATATISRYKELVDAKDEKGLEEFCAEKALEMAERQKVRPYFSRPRLLS